MRLRPRPSSSMAEALLLDEILEEILIRLPPSDPASLVRAATVCRRWCRAITAPRFRRRFAEHHRAAPMLGFLANLRDGGGGDDPYDYAARFVPATAFRPRRGDRRALEARHGRVLLTTEPWGPHFEVWDPLTGELRGVPDLPLRSPYSWNAAVVCARHGECDHLVCSRDREPFLVVCLGIDAGRMLVCVYSSEAGAWTEPTYGPPSLTYGIEMVPTALVGNAIYFLIGAADSMLKYDLPTRSMSVISLPSGSIPHLAVLTTNADGGLGFARVEDYRLGLWSMETETSPDPLSSSHCSQLMMPPPPS